MLDGTGPLPAPQSLARMGPLYAEGGRERPGAEFKKDRQALAPLGGRIGVLGLPDGQANRANDRTFDNARESYSTTGWGGARWRFPIDDPYGLNIADWQETDR